MKRRMKLAPVAVLGLLMAAAMPAAAQDRPTIVPTRDVAVTYRAMVPAAGQQAPQQQTLRVMFSAASQLMRVEGIGGSLGSGAVGGRGVTGAPGVAGGPIAGGYAIVDHRNRRMTVVMEQDRRYVEMPAARSFSRGFLLTDDMKFVRRSSETLAGFRCTTWEITTAEGSGTVCLTDDGVMLRGSGPDGRGGVEATQVSYGAQPAALFKPPADYTRLELPAGMMPGAGPPGAPPPGARR